MMLALLPPRTRFLESINGLAREELERREPFRMKPSRPSSRTDHQCRKTDNVVREEMFLVCPPVQKAACCVVHGVVNN